MAAATSPRPHTAVLQCTAAACYHIAASSRRLTIIAVGIALLQARAQVGGALSAYVAVVHQQCPLCATMANAPTRSATPPSASAVKAVPFSFLGCTSPPLSARSPESGSALLSGKAAPPLTVAAPRGSCSVLCFLRLAHPAELRRVVVRNSGSVFLAIHCAQSAAALEDAWRRAQSAWDPSARGLSDAQSAAVLRGLLHAQPLQQLCALEHWPPQPPLSAAQSPSLSRVRVFPLPPPSADAMVCAGVCLEVRGAEDNWTADATIGLHWVELYGLPGAPGAPSEQ